MPDFPSGGGGGGAKMTAAPGYNLTDHGPPTLGVQVNVGLAGAYGSYVQMDASLSADSFILGITMAPTTLAPTKKYIRMRFGVGAVASEVNHGEVQTSYFNDSQDGTQHFSEWFTYPIPVPAASRVALQAAGETAGDDQHCVLRMIDQADVVDI